MMRNNIYRRRRSSPTIREWDTSSSFRMTHLPLLRFSFLWFSNQTIIKHVVPRRSNYKDCKLRTVTSSTSIMRSSCCTTHKTSQNDNHWVVSLETPLGTKGESDRNQISFLSWNILAQYLFDSTPQWYHHVADDAPVSWPERFPLIMEEIKLWKADIVCLQEVEFASYEDLEPHFKSCGYYGVMQSHKQRTGDHAYGVATFYKSQKFDLVESIHRSRTMISLLKEKSVNSCEDEERIIAVLNCHLEGSPDKSVTRVKQLQHSLHDLSTKHTHHNVIICGDFNCVLGKSACSTYLQRGSCRDEDIYEWGRLVDQKVADIPPHPYSFHSAYPVELLTKTPMDYVTFVSSPHQYSAGLDQIWYHEGSSSVSVKGIKRAFHSLKHQRKILDTGLPSADHPSDHLPVGCILDFENAKLENLLKKKRVNYKTNLMSEVELRDSAAKLMDIYPFASKEEKSDFMYAISGINFDKDNKPTKEQILQIRDRRAKKKELFSKASNDNIEILEDVAKLIKAANSRK